MEFLRHAETNCKSGTVRFYKGGIGRLLNFPALANTPLDKLTNRDVDNYCRYRLEVAKHDATTVNADLRAHRRLRKLAVQWGKLSPDGRWLAFTLELPRGPEVFVQPFDRPGDRYQISHTGGTGAIWRSDSRELYYEGTDGLIAVAIGERGAELDIGTPQRLFALHTQGYAFNLPHNVEVAANGHKFLVNTIVGDSDNVPIEVTLNWTAGLKK